MSESSRRPTNVAMEQIIGNMTTSMHNNEGQYVHLGLTPPPSPSEHISWGSPTQSFVHCHNPEVSTLYTINQHQQLPQYTPQAIPFNYVQPLNRYVPESYEKCMYQNPNIQNHNNSNLYHQFFVSQPDQDNNNFQHHARTYHDNVVLNSTSHNNPTHLLENVVGNWVPNTSGTYSPFGNTNVGKPTNNIFDAVQQPEMHHSFSHVDDFKVKENSISDDFYNFHFNNRDGKKRIVAEVKPMRPSYSDVLTKSATPNVIKANKIDVKDLKQKKENNKKVPKNGGSGAKVNLQRLNSDIIKNEKAATTSTKQPIGKSVKGETTTFDQLNRRWSSLDNMHAASTEAGATTKKLDEISPTNKSNKSNQFIKLGKKAAEFEDEYDDHIEDVENRNDNALNTSKTIRKGSKNNNNLKQRNGDEKTANSKRAQRNRKREKQFTFGIMGQKIKQYVPGWWKLLVSFCLWLVNLVSDICSLSVHLCRDMVCNFWNLLTIQWGICASAIATIIGHMTFLTWIWDKIRKKKEGAENCHSPSQYSELEYNIAMPSTGDEAMRRLLACKGKDPYSILGVTPTCLDDDIKRYYKRQAFLVHPDKNQQPGAEEAFKILVHAFDMIGEPERRARYDRGVAESTQVEQAWSKLTELLAQLQKKVEAAANTIRCSACGLRHKRIKIDRPSYAARNCATCKIHHSAREGDIWAEAKCFGFLWHYFACMDGGIYDITEWAGCQKESLKHLKPNSHNVQYRIALGKQNGQQPRHSASPRNERQPNLENLLNSLYGNKDAPQSTKRRNKKSK